MHLYGKSFLLIGPIGKHLFNNEHILRRVIQLKKEFSCTLMPSQITDVFYANFIQWAREKGNCYSTIKLYCNQHKDVMQSFS